MTWAEGRTDTVQGTVRSRWEQTAGGLRLEVTVPGTASGTVRVPDLGADAVTLRELGTVVWSDGQPSSALPNGIEAVSRDDDSVVVEVGAGTYEFSLTTDALHVIGTRADDGAVYTGGQTNQIDIEVTSTDAVRVRNAIPHGWSVVAGDTSEVYEADGQRYVEFAATGEQVEVTYFAEAPQGAQGTGHYTFGPVEASPGGDWTPVSGTDRSTVVVGPDTNV